MNAILVIAGQELRAGIRNRWVAATTLVLAALALSLVLLGSAPTGEVGASPLAIVVVSLASLSIFLLPLIALMLSFDSIVGEAERGTLLLLLAYPLARWQVIVGKFVGQVAILALATLVGYGLAGLLLAVLEGAQDKAWPAFGVLVATSVMLGAVFVALGSLASVVVRERATAAGLAVGLWLVLVLLYDSALLGLLVADQGRVVTEGLLNLLLLANPADVYRLINLSGYQAVADVAGMAMPTRQGLPAAALYGVLVAWVMLPLGLCIALFSRRQP